VSKPQGLQGLKPAVHVLRVGCRRDPAAVLSEETTLRRHVESGKRRQALIKDRTHNVTAPRVVEELQSQRRWQLRAGKARLLQHPLQRVLHQVRYKQEESTELSTKVRKGVIPK
jgi:hypothetical protein